MDKNASKSNLTNFSKTPEIGTAFHNFVTEETNRRLKEDREKIAERITKGYSVPQELLHRITPSDKTPSNRYSEENRDELTEEVKEELLSQELDPSQIRQSEDDFITYVPQNTQDPAPEVEIKQSQEEAESSPPEEEQSGSDNAEDVQDSSPKASNDNLEDLKEASNEGEEDENFPILFLDVNLGKDRVERLVIYDGDDPFTVADEFCLKHCLEEKKKRKLAKVIKKQLDSLLTRIDEDEDEEDSRE